MNEFNLLVHGEDERVRFKFGEEDVTLSTENARFLSSALHNAAERAEGKGAYKDEITIFYTPEDEDKQKVGFDVKVKTKEKKETK